MLHQRPRAIFLTYESSGTRNLGCMWRSTWRSTCSRLWPNPGAASCARYPRHLLRCLSGGAPLSLPMQSHLTHPCCRCPNARCGHQNCWSVRGSRRCCGGGCVGPLGRCPPLSPCGQGRPRGGPAGKGGGGTQIEYRAHSTLHSGHSDAFMSIRQRRPTKEQGSTYV